MSRKDKEFKDLTEEDYEKLLLELDYLQYFYAEADFGPADSDVRQMMNEEYGELPEGY